MNFVDKDGRVTGHDGEFARIIAARFGRPIEFSNMKFMALIPALQSGKVDMIISGMTAKWEPSKFHDEYRDALLKLVERKVASGKTEVIEEVEDEGPTVHKTINFMDVLKRSVEHASKGRTKSGRASKAKTASRRRPRKQRAG